MELRPKEIKFGKTMAAYYGIIISTVALQLAALCWIRGIGPDHPLWRNPEAHGLLLKLFVFLLVVPPALAVFTVLRRNHSRRRHWRLVTEGVQIFRDDEIQATHMWPELTTALYRKKTSVVDLFLCGKFWPLSLPGIDQQTGQEFVELVNKGIRLAKEVKQDGGTVR